MDSVGVIIITHRARDHLQRCLPPILQSPLRPQVLLVNSSSNDGTVELAQKLGAKTLVIPRKEFNHGATREMARKILGTDIVVMLTPDVYPTDPQFLEKLVHPLVQKKASLSYARQIPHEGAGFFETFSRDYNYPEKSHIRTEQDYPRHGIYTYFCSNSCAAYLNKALDEAGGFPTVLFGEDTIVAAKLLRQGHKIAYVADAPVRHSHHYTLLQEFRRHFDIGLSRNTLNQFIPASKGDHKRGMEFTQSLIAQLLRKKPWLLPYAALQTVVKYFGYQIGRRSGKAPVWFKKILSSQDFYWSSIHAK